MVQLLVLRQKIRQLLMSGIKLEKIMVG